MVTGYIYHISHECFQWPDFQNGKYVSHAYNFTFTVNTSYNNCSLYNYDPNKSSRRIVDAINLLWFWLLFKADVHSLKKLKQECEKHKVCTNLGVAISDDLWGSIVGIEYTYVDWVYVCGDNCISTLQRDLTVSNTLVWLKSLVLLICLNSG